jgi:TetR/AcrR family transcriptional repressor of nem operon
MQKKMRYPAEETAARHDQIVKEASRLFREKGFENVSVADVMKAAGLTHGAFYAHFGSKLELEKAALAYGQGLTASRNRSYGTNRKGRRAYADRYLSRRHRDDPGDGCTMAALATEVARAPELKAAFERGFEEILSAVGGDRKEAIFQTAALLGGVVLARSVQDEQLSDEILKSVRQELR